MNLELRLPYVQIIKCKVKERKSKPIKNIRQETQYSSGNVYFGDISKIR